MAIEQTGKRIDRHMTVGGRIGHETEEGIYTYIYIYISATVRSAHEVE